jgi:hypothetical protein
MRVLSLSYCDFMTTDEVWRHECSDRIWVPRHLFRTWMSEEEAGSLIIVLLEGGKELVTACMYGYHNDSSNIIYAPSWICEALGTSLDPFGDDEDETDDDLIIMTRHRPSMCSSVKLQPFTGHHLRVEGEAPDEALSRGFEEYTCLKEGQTMNLRLSNGDVMTVTVVEAQPRHTRDPPHLCIRNTELLLDLLPPLDEVEHIEDDPIPRIATPVFLPMGGSPTGVLSFPGLLAATQQHASQHAPPVQPKALSNEERAQRRAIMAEAALRRFQVEPTGI